jgi:hypothetical protein
MQNEEAAIVNDSKLISPSSITLTTQFTANSCSPEGYAEYYGANSGLNQDFWNAELAICTPDKWTEEFHTGDWPERFVNCAEVKIVSGNSDSDDNNIFFHDDDDNVIPAVPTQAPILSTQPPVDVVGTPSIVSPVVSPVASPENNGGGCCSNDYKTCATWCQESRDQCGSSACVDMKWLDDGALENATCEPRWGACTETGTAGCCEGLVCKGSSPWYKQCLAPGDMAPSN